MMDQRISSFIKAQKNLTFCTSEENIPYCSNCFYAFVEQWQCLVFKSNQSTRHIQHALKNPHVAGTILPDLGKIGSIQGIQFTGKFCAVSGKKVDVAKKAYYSRHPMALTMRGDLWVISLMEIKMTDNTFGFGGKVHWQRTNEEDFLSSDQ
ncbi:MAG: pyridoxamine 5'-phosphate oxidase family protein [Bacteroidia bacterium]|nr:pyridoxamine 5'-phosphate oxidase family protein [Bacteroidia bacterium]MCC6769485.1 pyridoxamine 5'-phosphate oxidase family protein [Bacteroidia bacterium]